MSQPTHNATPPNDLAGFASMTLPMYWQYFRQAKLDHKNANKNFVDNAIPHMLFSFIATFVALYTIPEDGTMPWFILLLNVVTPFVFGWGIAAWLKQLLHSAKARQAEGTMDDYFTPPAKPTKRTPVNLALVFPCITALLAFLTWDAPGYKPTAELGILISLSGIVLLNFLFVFIGDDLSKPDMTAHDVLFGLTLATNEQLTSLAIYRAMPVIESHMQHVTEQGRALTRREAELLLDLAQNWAEIGHLKRVCEIQQRYEPKLYQTSEPVIDASKPAPTDPNA